MTFSLHWRIALITGWLLLTASGACSSKPPHSDDEDVQAAYADEAAEAAGYAADGDYDESDDDDDTPSTSTDRTSDAEAMALLQEVRAAYGALRTYADIVNVAESLRNIQAPEGDGRFLRATVHTNVARPNCLRVETHLRNRYNPDVQQTIYWGCDNVCTSSVPQHAFNNESGMGHVYQPPAEDWDALMAVAVRANPIIALLLPEKTKSIPEDERPFFDTIDVVELDGAETLDGRACTKLRCRLNKVGRNQILETLAFFGDEEIVDIDVGATIWIDNKTNLVRRINQWATATEPGPAGAPNARTGERMDTTYDFKFQANTPQSHQDLAFGFMTGDPEHALPPALIAGKSFRPTKRTPDAARSFAQSTLKKSMETYHDCKSYRDRYTIEITPMDRRDSQIHRAQGHNRFRRPGKARLDAAYKTPDGGEVRVQGWSDGETCKYWVSEPEQTHDSQNLEHVTAEFQLSHRLPLVHLLGLLDRERFGQSNLAALEGAILLGAEHIDEKPCHWIQARDTNKALVFLWIDGRSHLIRRLEMQHDGNWLRMTIRPAVNKKIPAKDLAFNPK